MRVNSFPDTCRGPSPEANEPSAFWDLQMQGKQHSDDDGGTCFDNPLLYDEVASWQWILQELEGIRIDDGAITMKKERWLQAVELYLKPYTDATAAIAATRTPVVLHDLDADVVHQRTAPTDDVKRQERTRTFGVEEVRSPATCGDRGSSDGDPSAAEHVFQRLSKVSMTRSGFLSETTSIMVDPSTSGHIQYFHTWSARVREKLEDFESNRFCTYTLQCFTLLLAGFELSQYCTKTVFEAGDAVCTALTAIDFGGNILFTLEVILYIMIFPWKFLCKNYYFWVDVVAIVSYYILVVGRLSAEEDNRGVEFLALSIPWLRILKTIRRSQSWRLLVTALRRSAEPIAVPMLFLILVVSIGSVYIYWIEKMTTPPGESPAFESVREAIWFSIVTVSTTGYGDVTPHTELGKLAGIVLIGVGVCCFAMPLAVVGNCFWSVWEHRHAILLTEKLKFMFSVAGVTFADLQHIFDATDLDGSGHMEFDEFSEFFDRLKLDIGRRELTNFFQMMDVTGQGKVALDDLREQLGMFQAIDAGTIPIRRISHGPSSSTLELDDFNDMCIAAGERAFGSLRTHAMTKPNSMTKPCGGIVAAHTL